jgi:sarcosine oxidase subunit delta
MLLIRCPYCGDRPEIEFLYAGEAHIARPRDPMQRGDAQWADYLYMRTNPKGLHSERWRHIHGCARFFNCVRDTLSDRIVATYETGEPRPNVEKLSAEPEGREAGR